MLKNADNTTKMFLIGIVFLLMILYILVVAIGDDKKSDYSFIENHLKNLGDNYTLNVDVFDKKIIYSRDKDVEVFESTSFENNKYIKYNNKIYVLKNDSYKEIESNNDLVNRYYYDLDLIKKVINKCKYKNSYSNEIECTIKSDVYNDAILSLYGLGRAENTDVYINFYYEDKTVNKMIINTGNAKTTIEIDNKKVNDYSNIINMIK